ncbi:hypothetical protein [Luedemannella helvata]|uniref:Uncharacterized protein n=1 Tax=Luedemannella helvata TaxID=349315 RepID=A0ABP4VU26_9ACTN
MNAAPLTDHNAHRLIAAIAKYDSNAAYDGVFAEVHTRLRDAGEAGKADIAIIAFWKRIRLDATWVGNLLSMPEEDIRRATRSAFGQAGDREALSELAVLPGFRTWGAMATALLCAYDPLRWPVMDRNAFEGLRQLGQRVDGKAPTYFRDVRQLRDQLVRYRPGTTVREIDKALFIIGREILDRRGRA